MEVRFNLRFEIYIAKLKCKLISNFSNEYNFATKNVLVERHWPSHHIIFLYL